MDWSLWFRALLLALMFEGAILFVAPNRWQLMARQMSAIDPNTLRVTGFAIMMVSLLSAWLLA
ncbi:MAG: DUF2065 domain-containing protein [Candidatus Porifericomitaceae bacterium WSBS_2022_MAG_OTU9]